jgi:NAD(P)H dehydrogenase (quinone)
MSIKEQIASRPRVLILGSTGRIGSNGIAELERINTVKVGHSSRKLEQVEAWRRDGKNAVLLDLDQPETFPEALSGIDRVFLATGYTVARVRQSKTEPSRAPSRAYPIYPPPVTSAPFGRSSHKEK